MAYRYKKEFFGEWLRGSNIRREEIKQVLGSSNGNNLQVWLGERDPEPLKDAAKDTGDRAWLPLRHILKLCNHYGLHLSDFIENAEEPPVRQRRGPKTEEDTIENLKEKYEKQMADQQNMMQAAIDAQRETIEAQRETIAALRGRRDKREGTDSAYPMIASEP